MMHCFVPLSPLIYKRALVHDALSLGFLEEVNLLHEEGYWRGESNEDDRKDGVIS